VIENKEELLQEIIGNEKVDVWRIQGKGK
jgi:hypothetical protein